MALRVLVAGDVTLDRYGDAWLAGGSVYYAAHAWRALGAQVRLVTAAGADFPPEALAGLEACVVPAPATVRFENAHQPDGTRTQRVLAEAASLAPASLPPGWERCDVLHLAPVLRELDLAAWADAVNARFVGIGVQGWVRDVAADGSVVQSPWNPDPALLRGHVHAACAGDDDLRGQGDLAGRLVASVPVVALTHGERGSEVISSGRTATVGVYATRAVDPVGAGDVFSAAMFHALAVGWPPEDAARLGAAAASVVIEARAGEALGRVGEAFARCPAVPLRE